MKINTKSVKIKSFPMKIKSFSNKNKTFHVKIKDCCLLLSTTFSFYCRTINVSYDSFYIAEVSQSDQDNIRFINQSMNTFTDDMIEDVCNLIMSI